MTSITCLIFTVKSIAFLLDNRPITRAVVCGNFTYTCGVSRASSDTCVTYGGGALAILRQEDGSNKNFDVFNPADAIGGGSSALLRWQLIDGKFHYIGYGFADLHSIYRTSANLTFFRLSLLEAVHAAGIGEAERSKRYHKYRNPGPNDHRYSPFLGNVLFDNAWKSDAIKRAIYYDIWANRDNEWEIYVTEPHKNNRLTREDFRLARNRRGAAEKRIWEKVGEWTFDWTGAFYVTARGDDRYFVTDTGRVYTAPRGSKPGATLKELWKGPAVEVLIHDADARKWYAFTKNQYYEIAEPIAPKPHTVPVRRTWTADAALETAAKCGRLIRGLPEPPAK